MRRKTAHRSLLYLFAGGFLAGILLMNLGKMSLLGSEMGIFDTSSLERLQLIEIDNNGLLRYILKRRMWELAILLLFSTTTIGILAVYAGALWRGLLAGMLMTAAMIRFGIKGILLILGSAFPQQMLLLPAWFMMLEWCYENCCRLHFPGKGGFYYDKSRRQQMVRETILLAWILIIIGIGCILESYVNPLLLSDFIKIF